MVLMLPLSASKLQEIVPWPATLSPFPNPSTVLLGWQGSIGVKKSLGQLVMQQLAPESNRTSVDCSLGDPKGFKRLRAAQRRVFQKEEMVDNSCC